MSHSTWFLTVPQSAPVVLPQFHQVLIGPQFDLKIVKQETPIIVIEDDNGPQVSQPLKIEECIDVSEPTLTYHNGDLIGADNLQDWTEINVKEDFSIYEEEPEREWIDWTELNVKEEVDTKVEIEVKESQSDPIQDTAVEESEKKSSLGHEVKNEEERPEEKFKCEHCSYKTNWRGNLTKHVISRHTALEEIKWFECAHCPYKGKTKEYLRFHLRSNHGLLAKWHHCPQCPFKAKAKCVLDKHTIAVHTEEDKIQWFECDQCPYKGKLRVNLRNHQLNKHMKHEEIKWFHCGYCTFKAKHRKNLKFHTINKHTEHDRIKWYKCDKCEHQVKAKKNLKLHMAKHHKDGKAVVVRKSLGTREVPVLIGNSICWKRVPIMEEPS